MSEYENSDGGTGGSVDVRSLSADELVAAMDRESRNEQGVNEGGPEVADDVLAPAFEPAKSVGEYFSQGGTLGELDRLYRDAGTPGAEVDAMVRGDMEQIGGMLQAAGIPAGIGRHLVQQGIRAAANPPSEADLQASAQTGEEQLRRAWGADFDKNLAMANSVIDRLPPDARKQANYLLGASGLCNDPYTVQTFYNLAIARGGRG